MRERASDQPQSSLSAVTGQPAQGWREILDTLATRRSCRDFDGSSIDRDILAEIVERSRKYPSIFVEPQKQEAGPPVGKPIALEISALDVSLL